MNKHTLSGLFLIVVLISTGCNSSLNTPPDVQAATTITPQIPTPFITPTPVGDVPPDNPINEDPPTSMVSVLLPVPEVNEQIQESQPPSPQPEITSTPLGSCLDEAAFYADVTIPDGTLLAQGASFEKTWQIRNTGTCTWEDGYSLVFASGDIMSGALSNPLPVISPGEIADISIDLIAPSRGGEQTGNWEFQNAQGERFGVGAGGTGYIWVQIQVEWFTADNTPGSINQASISNTCGAAENTDYENQVLSMINTTRSEQGLASLASNPALNNAALEHSLDMACQDYVDHVGSNGSTWYDRVASQGYANSNSARENIYVGDPAFGGTPDGAFTWWMNSQVHRENILNPSVAEIGIGYVYDQGSTYGGYYTVVFARP